MNKQTAEKQIKALLEEAKASNPGTEVGLYYYNRDDTRIVCAMDAAYQEDLVDELVFRDKEVAPTEIARIVDKLNKSYMNATELRDNLTAVLDEVAGGTTVTFSRRKKKKVEIFTIRLEKEDLLFELE